MIGAKSLKSVFSVAIEFGRNRFARDAKSTDETDSTDLHGFLTELRRYIRIGSKCSQIKNTVADRTSG